MEAELTGWISAFSYPAVVLLLLACGLGAPLSEDVILVTGGLLTGQGHARLPLMILAGWLGVVGGDLLLFRIGLAMGQRMKSSPRLAHLLTSQRAQRIQVRLRQHGWLTVFAARFVPGTRVPTYLLAGAGGVRPLHFLLADGTAALISVPVLVYLGHRFGRGILVDVERAGRWALLALALVGLVFLVRWTLRRPLRRRERQQERA